MIQNRFKAPVTAFITPSCRFLLRIGITANWLTFIGALGCSISALYFFSQGEFFLGTIFVALFALSDLFDGTMARLSERGTTKWGALIDSTLDRATDAAIYAGVIAYAIGSDENDLALLALLALITGALIPYIRAKAESLGVECSVGVAERAERLIIILIATGLYGLGVNFALTGGLLLINLLGLITIAQRLLVVARS
ncbi:MAG: CDP-alcohol phosphatidyltransferase family protein [Actinobacteria bacterium]|nr:CDP-alcohol phosphatidyltransferase family protein [Actinomycetota bacterium]NBO06965.1 CDP-alcohol phosphatidyltransferase family protein [Actinomycetota bacterium]NBO47449.1 CDP-alcohol phosphatidyltransferase family protein [Actinomycetota bacterium]NBP22276.1 CDP-alcohol phosphatidyltransferase family protein [Actinomycetota bacterium]NBQ00840.1 CDP-alcohol phosphatidyltransferase family protein [Actinomycetota bacterium]